MVKALVLYARPLSRHGGCFFRKKLENSDTRPYRSSLGPESQRMHLIRAEAPEFSWVSFV